MELLLMLCVILIPSFLIHYIRAQLYRDKDDKGPKMTGPATVKSHRLKWGVAPTEGSHTDYMVTFTLSDGEEIELYVTAGRYRALKDGQTGQLSWHGKRFCYFDSDTAA